MSKNDRIRDRYPIFDAYGGKHEFLGIEEAAETTVEGRIKSIWPFIVSQVRLFSLTLNPRERVNYDPEDVLSEIWLTLAEKDHKWTPDRGKYITFAAVVIDHEFCSIRDKARTIHAPRNSSCRLKKYREEEADGSITGRRAKTAADIRRTGDGTKDLGHERNADRTSGSEPPAILAGAESRAASHDAMKLAIRCLTPFESLVLGRLMGLWGRPAASVWRISWETGRDQEEVRRAKERAVLKIRKHLRAIKHPVAAA
jgi:hypothetical protein